MARRALPLEQLAALGLVLILLAATTVGQSALDSDLALAGPLLAVAALLLFFTPRVEVSLAVIALYLGLLDGYLKLSTGSSLAPVGRDVLIFVVVAGVLLRQAVTREQLVRPPFFEHILVFVAFVLVQAANPNAESAQTVANGVRQHLEFVPLFFLGFIVLRDARRLQGALAILLAIGAANGVVGAVQGALTPEQLASWGPGYSAQILGTGAFGNAGRAFGDALGEERVRPQALGSDFGAGGAFAVLAIPAGLALLIRRRRPVQRALAAGGLALSVVALLTSQARLNIIGAVIVVLAFALLTARTRERLRGFLVLAVGVALMYGVITLFVSNTEEGALERYNTLAPSRLVTTVTTDRGDPLALTPTYLVDHFFGVGIGRAGTRRDRVHRALDAGRRERVQLPDRGDRDDRDAAPAGAVAARAQGRGARRARRRGRAGHVPRRAAGPPVRVPRVLDGRRDRAVLAGGSVLLDGGGGGGVPPEPERRRLRGRRPSPSDLAVNRRGDRGH